MEEFLIKMAELLEVDIVSSSDEIISFDAWDSLTSLSIIAFSDENYGVTISANDILESKTIDRLFNLIQSKK